MSLQNKLDTIQANVAQVHQAGRDKQDEIIWNFYQQEGTRTDYLSAFSGVLWNSDTFKPMYNIQPALADMMFFWFNFPVHPLPETEEEMPQPIDLVGHCNQIGIALDFSKCTQMWRAFSYAYVYHIGVIDFASVRRISTFTDENGEYFEDGLEHEVLPTCWGSQFYGSRIETIDKLVFYSYNPSFDSKWLPENLINVTCEGTIFSSGLDLSTCPNLTKESIMSFIGVLADLNDAGYNQTVIASMKEKGEFVLTLGADHLAKLSDEDKAIATNKGWTLA